MHVCLFDIDGTLLNTGGAGQAAMEAALRAEFGVTKPVNGIPFAGRTDWAITNDMLEYYEVEATPDVCLRFLQAYLSHLPQYLGQKNGRVLPGIQDLLERLDQRNDVLLGLLTGNYREGAQLKLKHYSLHRHFCCGGFGDRHADRNDVAREALAEVQHHLDDEVDLERVWVIGDTPSDIRCARAIGAKVFAVGTGTFSTEQLEAEEPDHLLKDFSDPEPLLDLLK